MEEELISMPLNDRVRIGQRIAELRKARGISMRKLAELSDVNYANICKIEKGKYNVSVDILSKITSALECEVDVTVSPQVKPIPFRERQAVELVIDRDYYVSFGSNQVNKCRLLEIRDNRGPRQVRIEILSMRGRTTHVLYADEIGTTPEEAVINEVTF